MITVLILILAVAVGAAVLFTLRRRSGQAGAGAGGKSPEQDFVEAANAASKAARRSLAEARGGQPGGS